MRGGSHPSHSAKGSEEATQELMAVIDVKCKIYVNALGLAQFMLRK